MVSRPSRNVSFFSFCLNLSLLKTAVSRTHLDVLQRDISIDIGNPMDVGLRHLTRLQKMGDVHPIDRGVLPGLLYGILAQYLRLIGCKRGAHPQ